MKSNLTESELLSENLVCANFCAYSKHSPSVHSLKKNINFQSF